MRSRRLLIFLVAAVLAGCGASPTSQAPGGGSSAAGPFAKYANLSGAERTQKLLADAKTEGRLDIYTSNTDIDDLVDGFKQAYPGIKLNAFRANSETVLQRIQQEASARRTANDIVDTDDFELDALNGQGVLANYDSPIRQGLRKEALFPGWTATRFNAFVVGWNTKLVPAGQEPKSFEDLADPKWKGKLAMELSDFDWYMALHTYLTTKKGMSDTQANDLFKRLVANAKVVKGHTVMAELLGAGQTAVDAMNYSYITQNTADKGAPVAYRSADGIAHTVGFARPQGVGMMKGAKHPAAAWLFNDWMLNEGQKLLVSLGLTPSVKVPGDKSLQGVTLEPYDVQGLTADTKTWDDRYDRLLRGLKQIGGD
jgi:iron(III) transport system substrate-binding protein